MTRRWSNSVPARSRALSPNTARRSGSDASCLDRIGKRRGVSHGGEQSGLTVGDHLAIAADVGGDDRERHGCGLHGSTGQAFAPTGGEEQVRGRVALGHVVTAAQQHASVGFRSRQQVGSDRVGLVRIGWSDDHELDLRVGGSERMRSFEDFDDPLLANQAADHATHDVVVGDAPRRGAATRWSGWRSTRGRNVRGRRRCPATAPCGAESGASRRACRRLRGSAPTRRRRTQTPHVRPRTPGHRRCHRSSGCAVQPVLGVDDQRHPGEPSSDPAEHARLRVVGVHDVGPDRPEQPDAAARRPAGPESGRSIG